MHVKHELNVHVKKGLNAYYEDSLWSFIFHLMFSWSTSSSRVKKRFAFCEIEGFSGRFGLVSSGVVRRNLEKKSTLFFLKRGSKCVKAKCADVLTHTLRSFLDE